MHDYMQIYSKRSYPFINYYRVTYSPALSDVLIRYNQHMTDRAVSCSAGFLPLWMLLERIIQY